MRDLWKTNLFRGIAAIWALWLTYMLIKLNLTSGLGELGVLGDSFGLLSSLFASLALVISAVTNQAQSKQLEILSSDRKLQYRKQLYELFSDKNTARTYYIIQHDFLSFYPQAMLKNQGAYMGLRSMVFDPIELEASVDSLLSVVELTILYVSDGLVEDHMHLSYRVNVVLNSKTIKEYIETLKQYGDENNIGSYPFPRIYSKIKELS